MPEEGRDVQFGGEPKLAASVAAPAFSTGGGGFEFENLVGAYVAASLLAGAGWLGPKIGVPHSIRFQGKALGHVLDDLIVEGAVVASPTVAFSVKSFDMLRGGRLLPDFAADGWAHLLAPGFREGVDGVGLVCGTSAERNFVALGELVRAARTDTDAGLAKRIEVPRAFNATHRSLWQSAACPPELAAASDVDVVTSPARLLRHLLPLRLDLLMPVSQARSQATAFCRQALAPEISGRAEELWDALYRVVSEVRPTGGSLDWDSLLRALQPQFVFRVRPDAEPDWELLSRHTTFALASVRDSLGDGMHLDRLSAWTALEDAGDAAFILLTGPSGAGKTALAKRWLTTGGSLSVWLTASDLDAGLDAIRGRIGLRISLPDVLGLAARHVRVVVDGLDRAFDAVPFEATALLARQAAASHGRLRLLVTAQEMAISGVTQSLTEYSSPTPSHVTIGNLDDADVTAVVQAHSDLTRVVVRGQLVEVLRRPKLLDAVLRAGPIGSDVLAQITDETDVAALWWERFVQIGRDAPVRAEFALRLATDQADRLTSSTPAGEIGAANAGAIGELRLQGILDTGILRVAFAHELFGDWTRLQRLRALEDDALAYLHGKDQLPTWHRAIRLFALARLRHGGVERWGRDREALDASGNALLADLFLDAPLFSHDAHTGITELWPVLVDEDAVLLRRLLNRFLHVATYPDPRGQLLFDTAPELFAHFSAISRVPIWALWLPVIDLLFAQRDQAIARAPKETAAIVDLWLRKSDRGWPRRSEAAELGLELGRYAIDHITDGWRFEDDLAKQLYRACLASGSERPQDVVTILGHALEAQRVPGDEDES